MVLSSDGNASFAALIYDNPRAVEEFDRPLQVGFDAGDKTRGVNILGEHSVYGPQLQRVNLFRIDGKDLIMQKIHSSITAPPPSFLSLSAQVLVSLEHFQVMSVV